VTSAAAPGAFAAALPAPGSRRAWLLAARPATLGAAVVPVAVGTAVAYAAGGVAPGPALAALAGSICIQIGTNFANDVFDHEKGADTEERLGPPRAAALGLLSGRQLYAGIAVVFGLALACGVYLTAVAGWPVVAIGIASLLSGLAYTGGPYPLGYHGLGDVFVMAFFGFVAVCGTAFVQLGHVPELAWWASVPVGALATAILVVNNVRDRDTDVVAGKRTLAVRFGRGGALAEYVALLVLTYAVPVGLVATGRAHVWALLPLLTLPVAVARTRALFAAVGRAHNPVLVGTAKLLVLFGVLFAVGLALRA
jgi:1,4-dihydroxy-2-naphthoate octaprenyltransferase